jgi:hypothetical protein
MAEAAKGPQGRARPDFVRRDVFQGRKSTGSTRLCFKPANDIGDVTTGMRDFGERS